jgi:hypothetical protein
MNRVAVTRRSRRVVGWAEDVVALIEEPDALSSIPYMIAAREEINTGFFKLLDRFIGYTETTRCVFYIGDGEINSTLSLQSGKQIGNCLSPSLADDVTDKNDFQLDSDPSE